MRTSHNSAEYEQMQSGGHRADTESCKVFVHAFAAKNVILAGVKSVTLHDMKDVKIQDLSAQFYLTKADVGKNRAEACREKLQELNTAVAVSASSAELNEDLLSKFQVQRSFQLLIIACVHLAIVMLDSQVVHDLSNVVDAVQKILTSRDHVKLSRGS